LDQPLPGRSAHARRLEPQPPGRRPARFARSPSARAVSRAGAARVSATFQPLENVPLAPRCTMGVGGAARFFAEASDESAAAAAARWAESRRVPLYVLGGGSNLVVAGRGGARPVLP